MAWLVQTQGVMIERIVVGTDFSEVGGEAIAQGMRVARHLSAELIIVHVGQVAEHTEGKPRYGTYDTEIRVLAESMFRERRAELTKIHERLKGQGVEISKAIRSGEPSEGLCQAAEELQADLVVVGHGKTGIKRFLLGSVAEKVIRRCRSNVLVSRGSTRNEFRRILVPVNFDQWSDPAIECAAALASRDAVIELLHCWHLPLGLEEVWGTQQTPMMSEIRQAMIDRIDEKLNELLLRHRKPHLDILFDEVEASAQRGIFKRLDVGEYDLVVVGSHGREGVSRMLLGSVAEATMRHAPCPALIVKTRAHR